MPTIKSMFAMLSGTPRRRNTAASSRCHSTSDSGATRSFCRGRRAGDEVRNAGSREYTLPDSRQSSRMRSMSFIACFCPAVGVRRVIRWQTSFTLRMFRRQTVSIGWRRGISAQTRSAVWATMVFSRKISSGRPASALQAIARAAAPSSTLLSITKREWDAASQTPHGPFRETR